MNREEKYNLAKWAVDYALHQGADAASVTLANSKSNSIDVREQKIDTLEQAIERSLNIRIFMKNRYSSHTTNRLEKGALKIFIKRAIEATQFLAEDPNRRLPDENLYFTGKIDDLKTVDKDFDQYLPKDKIAIAKSIEQEVSGKDDRIISIASGYYDGLYESILVTSNGFEGHSANSYFGVHAGISVKGDNNRPESSWSESSIFLDQLNKTGVGEKALKRVLSKIGQKKIKSAKLPMLVENRQVNRLFSPLLQAINGANIQQQNSFLINKLHEKVFSDKLTVTDDPFLIGGRGSAYFDGEGIAFQKREVFNAGVVRHYYINSYYANKLDVKATNGESSNLIFQSGDKSQDELIHSLDRGILVTGFNGGNCNGTTGDYSYGIEGFLIENGKITQPVAEMNITGNMIELWSNIADVGNDLYKNSSWRTPSILFNDVSFSGI